MTVSAVRTFLQAALGLTAFLIGIVWSGAAEPVRTRADRGFNLGWRFHLGDARGAEAPDFPDGAWPAVDLPHDWSIALARDPQTPGGRDVGYYRGGIGWYRKAFVVPAAEAGREVDVVFDGVQQDCDVWINGHYLGFQPHGYVGFFHRLTPWLRPPGERNFLAVRAVNPENNSRWYAGSGIYRNVELRFGSALDVAPWGLLVDTIALTEKEAVMQIRADFNNRTNDPEDVRLRLRVSGPGDYREAFDLGMVRMPAGRSERVSHTFKVVGPVPWSQDAPALYSCELELRQGERTVGMGTAAFGIREIQVSATEGFRLNGRELKLKGACLHHDNGLLGAAAFDQAEWRRVRIMKQNGYNAIRTSHNPPSSAFLAACDRLGVLVIDEFADVWENPKRPNGYNRYFAEHWQQDLQGMVRRDYNSPSVVMWSIGNEIPERASPAGVGIARRMVETIRGLDRHRPITAGICHGWDHPEWKTDEWQPTAPAFRALDVGGYNYQWQRYVDDHGRFPDRVMMGTESFPLDAFPSWTATETHRHVIGDFVWTGMDHIGESGIGSSYYVRPGEAAPTASEWPVWINHSGDIDLIGLKKAPSYFRDVLWRSSAIEVLVHRPLPEGTQEVLTQWGWPAESVSWNWAGHEGRPLSVRVIARSPRVRVELNGRVVGESDVDLSRGIAASFSVEYVPGELRASALDADGKVIATKMLSTSGAATSIVLRPEETGVRAFRSDLLFVPLEIRDARGQPVPDAAVPLTASVDGPVEIVAFGTGDPSALGSVMDATAEAFHGSALLILRSTGRVGTVGIKVSSPGLTDGTATLQLE